jgi:predicted nucleic acid-binding protein
MSVRCFLDTNILVYGHDDSAGAKHDRALRIIDELWSSRCGVLSTQVLPGFCVAVKGVNRSYPTEYLQ